MYIIVCTITGSIATTDHCWTRVVCMRTIKFETEQEAQAYVMEHEINNVAIVEEYSNNRMYTDAVEGFTVFGTIVQCRSSENFNFCSIRQPDRTMRIIRQ